MKHLGSDVAARLRQIMEVFHIADYIEMGELCGASCSQVNNWLNDYNLPRVPEMIRLCDQIGITLDWVYRGHIGWMDPNLCKRLAKHAAQADA
jgi:hypothetical protein